MTDYQRIERHARLYCKQYPHPSIDADDVAADGYVAYLESSGDIQIAFKAVRASHSRMMHSILRDYRSGNAVEIEPSFVPDDELEISEETDRMYSELAKLDSEEQLLAYWRMVKGETLDEVARRLGIPITTIHRHENRITRHLQTVLN